MEFTPVQTWMLFLLLLVNFAIPALGARIGDRGHGTEVWFASLRKPAGYPDEALFTPVWCAVAIVTGVAGWLIWGQSLNADTTLPAAQTALVLYGFALGFNALWQGVSIGMRRLGRGLAWGWLTWGTITLTGLYAAAGGRWVWVWLLPYWLWTGYGLKLNYSLWHLNRPAPAPAVVAPQPAPPDPLPPPPENGTPRE
ncbi:MAG TPA: TspO/MBR family protein [Terriglobales bacterium]